MVIFTILNIILAFSVSLLIYAAIGIGVYTAYRGCVLGANEEDMGMVFAVCYAAYLSIYGGIKKAVTSIIPGGWLATATCVIVSGVPFAYVTLYAAVAFLFSFLFHFKKNMKAFANLIMVGIGRFMKSAMRRSDDDNN